MNYLDDNILQFWQIQFEIPTIFFCSWFQLGFMTWTHFPVISCYDLDKYIFLLEINMFSILTNTMYNLNKNIFQSSSAWRRDPRTFPGDIFLWGAPQPSADWKEEDYFSNLPVFHPPERNDIGAGGSTETSKTDYVIYGWPLIPFYEELLSPALIGKKKTISLLSFRPLPIQFFILKKAMTVLNIFDIVPDLCWLIKTTAMYWRLFLYTSKTMISLVS